MRLLLTLLTAVTLWRSLDVLWADDGAVVAEVVEILVDVAAVVVSMFALNQVIALAAGSRRIDPSV